MIRDEILILTVRYGHARVITLSLEYTLYRKNKKVITDQK